MTPQELTTLIDAYSEVYSNALTEEVAEVGQSPTPGGVKKAPPSALPQRKKGQPITSIKDSYEIVLNYLIGEGFASDKHSAEQIMLGMSEAWVGQIVEARVDDNLSSVEKKKARNIRAGLPNDMGGDFIRGSKNRRGRGKSPEGPVSVEPTKDTQRSAKVRMARNHPEHPFGKKVTDADSQDRAERGSSGRRGS
jgi:hypothetical protein